MGALDALNNFASIYGAQHYGCLAPESDRRTITLEKVAWKVPRAYDFGDGMTVTPLRAGEEIAWRIVEE